MALVAMHGPSISDPSKTVNRDVPEEDVQAYKAVGYVLGYMPESKPAAVAAEAEKPKDIVTKAKPKGRSKK